MPPIQAPDSATRSCASGSHFARLEILEPSITPVCLFESLDPEDIPSAIKTNTKRLARTVVRVAPLGLGYEQFLEWAVQDAEVAVASTKPDQQSRFSVSALMNARRSLSCLADQYLSRDGFAFCRDAPREADEKADLLVRRGLFDKLASSALGRAVERRNRVEHDYGPVALNDVQDTVHLIRTTIENCVSKSDPYWAPAFFGSFQGGYGIGPAGERHWFGGWLGLLFVFARCASTPWFGVVTPSSAIEAIVRRVAFSALSCDQLSELLALLEAQASAGFAGYGEPAFRGQLTCAGLIP